MDQPDFKPLAEESLSTFSEIAKKADEKLKSSVDISASGSFANINTFTGGNAVNNMSSIQARNREALALLKVEPAIARLVVEDSNGDQKTIYVARKESMILEGEIPLAASKSLLGRLASLDVGDEKTVNTPSGEETYYLLEKIIFYPQMKSGDWDSFDSRYKHDDYGACTLESLRAFLKVFDPEKADELDRMLEEEGSGSLVIKGITHQLRTAMSLRDQPILDKFQSDILDFPLDSQLIIIGPPGTGKTTTLIRRLGEKLDYSTLESHEKNIIEKAGGENRHTTSWLMFTPSELLRHYLKEAFSREQVPASDDRIKTWSTFRVDLARNKLGILKTAHGGRFRHQPNAKNLSSIAEEHVIDWIREVESFHEDRVFKQLAEGVLYVDRSAMPEHRSLADQLMQLMKESDNNLLHFFDGLAKLENEIKKAIDTVKAETDDLLKKQRNLLYNRDQGVFNDLAQFLETLKQDDDDSDEDAEFDETEDADSPAYSDIKKAVNAYLGFLRVYSRHQFDGKRTSKKSRAGKIKEWLGERIPDQDTLLEIGIRNHFLNGMNRFTNPTRRYVLDVPMSYRFYRKQHFDDHFYTGDMPAGYDIDSNELDVIILLMLKNMRLLLSQSFVRRNLDAPKLGYLKDLSEVYKHQVMVDEVTDFSVLQILCMYNLTSPSTNSFFACGDFNQRITNNGIRSLAEITRSLPGITEQKITTVYRQSRHLNALAESLLRLSDGDLEALGVLPEDSVHEGVPPALVEGLESSNNSAAWIAKRVKEIERTVRQMPTIAVLVNSEFEVQEMADNLTMYLEEISMKATACVEGKALGEGTDVRVFEVQHIKGLEFEAVFFAGVDQLAENTPDVYERYLYVGATRAASYLGMVCYDCLPDTLAPIRGQCVESWMT